MPTRPAPCKISPSHQINDSKMPVTINLCKDTQCRLATSYQFASVDVFDSSGNKVPNQPSELKSSSFVLSLPAGDFDVNATVAPSQGTTAKPTLFLYEACTQSPAQLSAAVTSVSPGCSFHLKVTP
jgi:hypothetical protein